MRTQRCTIAVLALAGACGTATQDNRDSAGTAGPGSLTIDAGGSADATDGAGATSAGTQGPATSGVSTTLGDSTVASADGPDPDGAYFDVGVPDVPPCSQGAGGVGLDFSYIWVANSAQGTVSKIDTQTMAELGRYLVRPDGLGNPSRTSVNLVGDVAIANRAGGITKIHARAEDCVESNGMAGLQTSSGATDILAWDLEECRAWYAEMPYNVQRPVAWTAGTFDESSCAWVDQHVWTTGGLENTGGSVVALRLDGDTGVVDVELPVPEIGVTWAGPYGGAVDAEGDFWFHSRDAGVPHPLVHVYADGSGYEIVPVPDPVVPYGITVDSSSRIWLAGYQGGVGRYDPAAGTWQTVPGVTGLGIQEDARGRMWMAIYPWGTTGVVAFDVETMAVVQTIDMTATTPSSRGVSIDFEGYVWLVDQDSSAFKIDPATSTWEEYAGLTGPYTYSDMTGWGLSLVTPG
jgi:hypothetical protein